jgi:hypothetical protein
MGPATIFSKKHELHPTKPVAQNPASPNFRIQHWHPGFRPIQTNSNQFKPIQTLEFFFF